MKITSTNGVAGSRQGDIQRAMTAPSAKTAEPARTDATMKVAAAGAQLSGSDPLLTRYIALIERIFGVHVAIVDPADLRSGDAGTAADGQEVFGTGPWPALAITLAVTSPRAASDQVEFHASGRVTTEDGRAIDLELESKVSRQYLERTTQQSASSPTAEDDSVVLELGGLPASLTTAKVDFDVSADGQLDRLHFFGDRVGQIAWDRGGASDLLSLWRPNLVVGEPTTSPSAMQVGATYLGQDTTPGTPPPGSPESTAPQVDRRA